MSAQYAVTFNRRSDDTTGLRGMSYAEALKLVNFAAIHANMSGRIVPKQVTR